MADKRAAYEDIFNSLDKDGSGELTRAELVDGLQERLQGDRNAALDVALEVLKKDENQDNKITLKEFLASLGIED